MMPREKIKGLMALAGLILLVSCSDGELKIGDKSEQSIITPAPQIISFTADKEEIKAGEAVTLSWEVVNADLMEISGTSNDGSFEFHSDKLTDLTGSLTVEDIPDTTEFVLTARATSKEPGSDTISTLSAKLSINNLPKEGSAADITNPAPDLFDQAYVVVTVVGETKVETSITADKDTVTQGEQTVIRWEVKPADGLTLAITASSGEVVQPKSQEHCSGDINSIIEAPIADPTPAVGCAVVKPQETTIYSVIAKDVSGTEFTSSTTVSVKPIEELIISFTFDDGSIQTVVAAGETKGIIWKVAPEMAQVDIAVNGNAACDLPDDLNSSGTAECTINGNTDFVLTATIGNQKKSAVIKAVVGVSIGADDIIIRGPSWGFEGEELTIYLVSKNPALAASVSRLTVNGQEISDISTFKEGKPQAIKVKMGEMDLIATAYDKNGQIIFERKLASALRFNGSSLANPISKIAISGDSIYYGLQTDYKKAVIVKRTGDTSQDLVIDGYITDMLKVFDLQNTNKNPTFYSETVTLHPVGSIAFDETRIYVGLAGAVMYSEDGGSSWKIALALPLFTVDGKQPSYDGQHNSCRGTTQTGYARNGGNDIVSLITACDILAKDGSLYVATDFGLAKNDNINAFIENPSSSPWKLDEFKGAVVNDIIDAGNLYVAVSPGEWSTTAGVYVNNGGSWTQVEGISGAAYALATDGAKVFVGTENGIYEIEDNKAKLTHTIGQVYSIGTADGVIVAGTDDGITVIRNETATKLKLESISGTVKALALTSDGGKISISFATGSNYLEGSLNIKNMLPTKTPTTTTQ